MPRYINLDELLTSVDKRNGRLPLWLDEILMEDCKVADVEPVRHGHWVEEYDCGYITPHCSECGETALTKEETSYDYVYSSYCPRCGAKMDGGEGE